MKKAILATKVGMTQIFNEDGVLTPVTVLQAGPCVVTQVKTVENDGYSAVQVGYVDKREKLVNKPMKGMFDKAGVSYKRFVREFKFENAEEYSVKDEIKVDVFEAGDKIDVTAISKGKGFQGAIKRHGQSRGPMAHGSKYHRHAGSNGACSDPSKVFKGKKMPGQMGAVQVTIQNLEVVRVDAENDLLLAAGILLAALALWLFLRPGDQGGWVVVAVDGQEQGRYPLWEDRAVTVGNEVAYNVLEIANGQAAVREANCGDHTCVRTGAVSREGEVIVCLPHRLTV